MPHNKPRLLVVTAGSWTGVEPFLWALDQAGFALGLVHGRAAGRARPDESVALFPARPSQFRQTVERGLRELPADLVIPADELSFRHLGAIYRQQAGNGTASSVATAIARSFGDPAAREQIASLAALQLFAREHGLPVPHAVAVGDEATLRVLLEAVPLPVMLKDEGGWAGARAEIGRGVEAGIAAYRRFTGASHLAKMWPEARQHRVFLQQHIDGIAAKRSVACRDGTVLAGVSAEPLDGAGPALVAKIISHPTMENIAAFVVKTLKLSGIVGFDFVLERDSRQAWLTAVKPYATPVSQLMIAGGAGLAEALYALHADIPVDPGRRPPARGGAGVVTPFPRPAHSSLAALVHPRRRASGARWR